MRTSLDTAYGLKPPKSTGTSKTPTADASPDHSVLASEDATPAVELGNPLEEELGDEDVMQAIELDDLPREEIRGDDAV
jgi:hypothetical protein